jgi:magnesium chelatase family protein
VTLIAGLAGRRTAGLADRRPFRAPHHSITAAGLVGAARRGWVGEAVLAHNGVLFLDELAEFAPAALQTLRQPLEEGRVAFARARQSSVYPARFMLLGATNPCPCGFAGERERCACSEGALARHRRRLSGPLLDRIDLLAHLGRDLAQGIQAAALTRSADAREQVMLARERQSARYAGAGARLNAHVELATLLAHLALEERAEALVHDAARRGLLSARGQHRVLRVARTVADLDASRRVRARDVGVALALRPEAIGTGLGRS